MKLSICVMSTLVNDRYKDQIKACQDTWAKDADRLGITIKYFCGSVQDSDFDFVTHLDGVGDDYVSATYKQYRGLQYLQSHHPADFYLIVGTDNYVDLPRVLKMLEKYRPEYPFIIGGCMESREIFGRKISFSLGGSGIFLSHGALELASPHFDNLIESWNQETDKPQYSYLKPACDVSIYYLASELGITLSIERDLYPGNHRGDFYNMNILNGAGVYPKMRLDRIVICHFMEPPDMHQYHSSLN